MNFPRIVFAISLTSLLCTVGCNGRSYQVSSPVIGPVPPRIPASELAQSHEPMEKTHGKAVRGQSDLIQQVRYAETQPLGMTDVIAEVNGEPILAHQILDRYAQQLIQAKQTMKPEQIRKAQLAKIAEDLPALIDQTLMVDSLKTTMKPEQLISVDAQLDTYFESEVERLMKVSHTGSPIELEGVLQAQGSSLVALRKNFGDRQLAGQFKRAKMGVEPTASREEMLERYEADVATFTEAAEIKWQQIDIDYDASKRVERQGVEIAAGAQGGVEGAESAAQQLLEEIRSGKITFDEAAHDRSDSPLASKGGHRDWTRPESLADADVKAALTSLNLNEISEVIPTKSACIIVMLTGRHEARVIPFNEVQKELHERIVKDKMEAIGEEVMKELKANAVIHTILEEEQAE